MFGQQEPQPVSIEKLQKRASGFETGSMFLVIYDKVSDRSVALVSSPNFRDFAKAVNSNTPIIKTSKNITPDFSLTVQFDFAGKILKRNIDEFDLFISAKDWEVLADAPLLLKTKRTVLNLGMGKKITDEKAVQKTDDEPNRAGNYKYKISRNDLETAVESGKLEFSAGTKREKVGDTGRTAFRYILKLGTL